MNLTVNLKILKVSVQKGVLISSYELFDAIRDTAEIKKQIGKK